MQLQRVNLKGEDISGRILLLVSQLGEVQKKGTPDIEFAIVGLLARSQIALGRAGCASDSTDDSRAF